LHLLERLQRKLLENETSKAAQAVPMAAMEYHVAKVEVARQKQA